MFSHSGIGGSSPGNRMAAAGYEFTGSWAWGENIAWAGTTGSPDVARYVEIEHEGLFLSEGHRLNTMNGISRKLVWALLRESSQVTELVSMPS